MRLPFTSRMHRLLTSSHDVARDNARVALEAIDRRRRERDEVEAFFRELERGIAR